MNFKTQNNRLSFAGRAAAAKQWIIGWTVSQATPGSTLRAGQDRDRPVSIGSYGLLAGAGRLGLGR